MQIGFENGSIDVATEVWYENYKDWFVEMKKKERLLNWEKYLNQAGSFGTSPQGYLLQLHYWMGM